MCIKDENRPTFELRVVLQVDGTPAANHRITCFTATRFHGERRTRSTIFQGRGPTPHESDDLMTYVVATLTEEILTRLGIQGTL